MSYQSVSTMKRSSKKFIFYFVLIENAFANPHLNTSQSLPVFAKCCNGTELFDGSSYSCIPRRNTEVTSDVLHPLLVTNAANLSWCDPQHRIYSKIRNNISENTAGVDCVDFIENEEDKEDQLIALKCLECTEEKPCVNFCCPDKFVFKNWKCSKELNTIERFKAYSKNENFTYVNTELTCDGGEIPDAWPQHLWEITKDGVMINSFHYDLNKYCIDQTQNKAIACPKFIWPRSKIIVMWISIACILIIIVINCASEELRNSSVTGIKIPLLFFLALSFVLWLINHKFRRSIRNTIGCVVIGSVHTLL